MPEKLDKAKPVANVLAAFASTIGGAFAVGLPMAVAITYVCS
jgi:shikimate kinase